MSPVFAARRRAEEFASLVDGTSTGEPPDPRARELAELVGALRGLPPAQARPAFVADLRERLVAEAATALLPDAGEPELERRLTVGPRRTARDRRIAAALGGFALVGATTSMAVAAQSALPGETLYPLKRAIENAQTGFSASDNQKGSHLLANASDRLDEVEELTGPPEQSDTQTVTTTLEAFTDQADEASTLLLADFEEHGDDDAIAELRDFTGASMATLADLEAVLPDGARPSLVRAAQVLTRIDADAAALCSSCGGEGISFIPPFAVSAAEEVLGGLAGAITDPPAGPSVGGSDTTPAPGSRPTGAAEGGAGEPARGPQDPAPQEQQPSTPADPAPSGPLPSGGQSGGTPAPQPTTLGEVLQGVLGGGNGGGGKAGSGGAGGGGKTPASGPSTLPEVLEEVLGGSGGLVGPTKNP